jgi:light-regulated signal transduction histidine kinase (bacteriophytochrome)
VPNAHGRPVRVAVFSRDITAQTAAEERLARHVAEIERSNAELEQFAYVASHDLREPLRMISSYMSLIERRYADRLDNDGIEFLGYAREGALRMDRLVLDLLDFSRIGRGAPPMNAVAMLPLLEQTLADLTPLIGQIGARIDTDLGTPPPVVLGDPAQLGRLLQNLIGNALKYRTPERGVEIRITATRSGDEWLLSVADNGIGIEAEHFERIFRIFQRLHTQDRFEGTGIGLAICRKIVERHGGRIWVESVPGAGSRFDFTLPATPDRA